MSPFLYYLTSIILYGLEVFLAILINDIGNVFGFIGTIAGTSLSFFIPSALFMLALKQFGDLDTKRENNTLWWVSLVNAIVGVGLFVVFLYSNILSL